ncbi:Extracellular endo-alpha-(1-_5)-L-arabinanase 1 [Massilia sp. Bi118]|uniref:family 43 glycosylhydrolase n=1 Tax=Massilia sp. Bi118 TaxID=2822346 RepID=UPI001DDAF85F|nr:family 43 glycosylhydrolase [Massilia sp. Bi118]CAH0308088.1 Extracellular endo-alpha-(1->5)-L-arabinanase 1 [Massilia sp. Bi118]
MPPFRSLAAVLLTLPLLAGAADQAPATRAYHNPLTVRLASGEPAQNCADPAVLRDPRAKTPTWYMYCTSDPVSKKERDPAGKDGGWHFRMIPIYRSTDLVHWDFVSDAFSDRPAGLAAPTSGLWAPEPEYLNGRYYLYFTVTDVVDAHSPEKGCGNDSAIGVATADSPTGPWRASTTPVVMPRRAKAGCNFDWTFDPKVIEADKRKYLYYGSYGGGIFVTRLSDDGLRAEGRATMVGAPGRYEGAELKFHDGWWYMFASATDCCNGPLTGYAVYTGRARRPEGPFLDRYGNDMAKGRSGGTPLLLQNGNRWIGVGHNTVFTDAAGQWWTIYHGIDQAEPFFSAKDKLTRRLALLDRIDWVDGWPVAGGGRAPSDQAMAAPIVAEGDSAEPHPLAVQAAASAKPLWHDDFRGRALNPRWSWLRPRADKEWSLGREGLVLATQNGDLYVDRNTAGVLQAALPQGDYRIEAEIRLDAPEDCCTTAVQAGLVVMRDDDNYVKLVEMAREGLRQVEFAKEMAPVEAYHPRYGNTLAGTPGATTWLRLDVHRTGDLERYTGYSSQDGRNWVGGGTWRHRLGRDARLGLVAMGGAGRRATFVRVAVSALSP